MMAYLSHLLECGEMDEILMFYLMVGHTHSSIDQYFSVLAHAINSTEFIGTVLLFCCSHIRLINIVYWTFYQGTPMAMQYLVAHAHSEEEMQPVISKEIKVCFSFLITSRTH